MQPPYWHLTQQRRRPLHAVTKASVQPTPPSSRLTAPTRTPSPSRGNITRVWRTGWPEHANTFALTEAGVPEADVEGAGGEGVCDPAEESELHHALSFSHSSLPHQPARCNAWTSPTAVSHVSLLRQEYERAEWWRSGMYDGQAIDDSEDDKEPCITPSYASPVCTPLPEQTNMCAHRHRRRCRPSEDEDYGAYAAAVQDGATSLSHEALPAHSPFPSFPVAAAPSDDASSPRQRRRIDGAVLRGLRGSSASVRGVAPTRRQLCTRHSPCAPAYSAAHFRQRQSFSYNLGGRDEEDADTALLCAFSSASSSEAEGGESWCSLPSLSQPRVRTSSSLKARPLWTPPSTACKSPHYDLPKPMRSGGCWTRATWKQDVSRLTQTLWPAHYLLSNTQLGVQRSAYLNPNTDAASGLPAEPCTDAPPLPHQLCRTQKREMEKLLEYTRLCPPGGGASVSDGKAEERVVAERARKALYDLVGTSIAFYAASRD